jgi:hypothetical protein
LRIREATSSSLPQSNHQTRRVSFVTQVFHSKATKMAVVDKPNFDFLKCSGEHLPSVSHEHDLGSLKLTLLLACIVARLLLRQKIENSAAESSASIADEEDG